MTISESSAMLQTRNISVCYDSAIVAIENIDFDVSRGALVALLGSNGAGKTTLLKAIAGMLPFERGMVTEGSILFDGASIATAHPAAIARKGIALVQDGRQCFRDMTVRENLKAASLLKPSKSREMLDLVFAYFPFLVEAQDRLAGHMSGGQLQMLVIAMALMGQPKLLLLDEPSLGLSPVMTQAVFDAVEQMHRDLGMSVVVAEQTVPRLLQIATDVYVLSRGCVAVHAPPAETSEELLQHVYMN